MGRWARGTPSLAPLERSGSASSFASYSRLAALGVAIQLLAAVAAPVANAQVIPDGVLSARHHPVAASVEARAVPDLGTTGSIGTAFGAALSFGDASVARQNYVVGTAIDALTLPEANGGAGAVTYALSPPPGLTFNATTRRLSGTRPGPAWPAPFPIPRRTPATRARR